MLTIIAVFLLISRCKLLAERNEVICSRMLSCILGVCSGRQIANSWSAAFTTSVAGGSGSSIELFDLLMYSDIESYSRAPQIGESN